MNKLEGDATLLYSQTPKDMPQAFSVVLAQLGNLFDAFDRERMNIAKLGSHCPCDACASIGMLDLKAFVHSGDILIKQVRQFEELAGEPVIFVHRLMKNTVNKKRYVLVSEAFIQSTNKSTNGSTARTETLDGFGACHLFVLDPISLPRLAKSIQPTLKQAISPDRSPHWNHFPLGEKPGFFAFNFGVLKLKLGLGRPVE